MKIFYNKEFILNVTKEKLSSYIEMKYGPLLAIEDNFIDGIVKVINDRKDFDFKCGCKLNNLVQELSYKDEDFKSSLEKIYLRFENIFEQVLNKAIEKKEIIKTNTNELSVFTVASIEGCISTAKKSQNEILYNSCISHLENI